MKKIESLYQGRRYKEPNENFKTEKYNTLNKKLSGQVQHQNGVTEERISDWKTEQ